MAQETPQVGREPQALQGMLKGRRGNRAGGTADFQQRSDFSVKGYVKPR